MKMLAVENTFKTNIEGSMQRLAILATAKSMSVLSKGIYSRPIEACIRELSTNAVDAHTEAGFKDRPIEVNLPTYQDQTFVVRDYGKGIPPDKVRDIFATYFASDKTESNDLVGCLGIGALSPFAIASQFTVETWIDGYYYLWSIFKDEEDIPSIHDEPLIKQPTVEPTGTKISVPLTEFKDFETTAVALYRNFDVIPNVYKGSKKIDIKAKTPLESFPSFSYYEGYGIYAKMGNILYPIDTSISGLEGYGNFNNNQMIIPFEIGELDFSASRESLEYNKRVIMTLKGKLAKINNEVASGVADKIALAKNAYNAVIAFWKLPLPVNMKKTLFNIIDYKGKKLSHYFSNNTTAFDISCLIDSTKDYGSCFIRYSHYSRKKTATANNSNMNEHIRYYYNDCGMKRGVHSLFLSLENSDYYLFNEEIDIDKWCELNHYDKDDLIGISTIKTTPYMRDYESRLTAGLFEIRGGSVQKDFWRKLDKTPPAGYYFVKSGDKFVVNGKEYFPTEWDFFKNLNILPTDKEIYGISKSHLKNFKDWTKMEDVMISVLETKRADIELVLANRYSNLTKLLEYLPDGDFKNKIQLISDNSRYMETWSDMYNMFQIPLVHHEELELDAKNLVKQYPMIKMLLDTWDRPSVEEVRNYISCVDLINKKEEEENVG